MDTNRSESVAKLLIQQKGLCHPKKNPNLQYISCEGCPVFCDRSDKGFTTNTTIVRRARLYLLWRTNITKKED